MDPNQIVASYADKVAGLAARAEEAKEQIKQLAGTATSRDGAVTVTVNGAGALQDVQFGQRAKEISLHEGEVPDGSFVETSKPE